MSDMDSRDLQRQSTDPVDYRMISQGQLETEAVKAFIKGAGNPLLLKAAWKLCREGYHERYLRFRAVEELTGIPIRFMLYEDGRRRTALPQRLGTFLRGIPKKLLERYEELADDLRQTEPLVAPALVIRVAGAKNPCVFRGGVVNAIDAEGAFLVCKMSGRTFVIEPLDRTGHFAAALGMLNYEG